MLDQNDFGAHLLERGTSGSITLHPAAAPFTDPLGEDEAGDEVVHATRRGLARLALVASETATRFLRDEVGHDPMAWMLSPRRMFGGAAAVDACLGRDECVRALVLHSVGTRLDADPERLDALAAGWEDEDGDRPTEASVPSSGWYAALPEPAADRKPALFTTTAVEETSDGLVHVFEAVVARGRAEAEALFVLRHGAEVAAGAEMVEGFRPDLPLVSALVSPAMADMLSQIDADPCSPLARGLHVTVEQRFAA